MTIYEKFRNAIARRDPAALLRMAKEAEDEQTRISLTLLAGLLELQNKRRRTRRKRSAAARFP